ncbi:unnamed protein product [Rotaria sordida]|uniref:Uncharacterized protein n=3 Tax=Rotaria sordida TaxID=392033 RepID=A0A820CFM5_9BILA|nr:unnamed protein product [Rotaria sordida]
MPDFCRVDYYNLDIRSSTSDSSKFSYCRLSSLSNDIRIYNTLLGIDVNSMVFIFNCFLNNDETNQYALKITNKSVDKGPGQKSTIVYGVRNRRPVYNGTLSTVSTFILEELSNDRHRPIECLPIDECISFMKMILLEIILEKYKEAVSSKIQQGSFTDIILVYDQIRDSFKNKQPIIMKVIEFLEKHRSILNVEKLNNYIVECIKNRQCLIQLENQQINIDFWV